MLKPTNPLTPFTENPNAGHLHQVNGTGACSIGMKVCTTSFTSSSQQKNQQTKPRRPLGDISNRAKTPEISNVRPVPLNKIAMPRLHDQLPPIEHSHPSSPPKPISCDTSGIDLVHVVESVCAHRAPLFNVSAADLGGSSPFPAGDRPSPSLVAPPPPSPEASFRGSHGCSSLLEFNEFDLSETDFRVNTA